MLFEKGNVPWNKGKKGTYHLWKNRKHPLLGKRHSDAHKLKLSESLKGRVFTEEHKQKISQSRMGVKHRPMSKEGRKNMARTNNGRVLSLESRKKISEGNKLFRKRNPLFFSGKNNPMYGRTEDKNPNWQGGKTFEEYGFDFDKKLKDKIRNRDNYTCQECNYSQEDLGYLLCVHHIDYNKKNNVSNNLISLCRSCHTKTNFNREEWIDYYKEKVCYD